MSDWLIYKLNRNIFPFHNTLHLLPNGIGAHRVHAVADRQGQTEQLQGVRVLAVQLLSFLNIHLYELHPRLVSVELRCVAGQATHAPTTQDEVEIVQLPLLQGHNFSMSVIWMRQGKWKQDFNLSTWHWGGTANPPRCVSHFSKCKIATKLMNKYHSTYRSHLYLSIHQPLCVFTQSNEAYFKRFECENNSTIENASHHLKTIMFIWCVAVPLKALDQCL